MLSIEIKYILLKNQNEKLFHISGEFTGNYSIVDDIQSECPDKEELTVCPCLYRTILTIKFTCKIYWHFMCSAIFLQIKYTDIFLGKLYSTIPVLEFLLTIKSTGKFYQ